MESYNAERRRQLYEGESGAYRSDKSLSSSPKFIVLFLSVVGFFISVLYFSSESKTTKATIRSGNLLINLATKSTEPTEFEKSKSSINFSLRRVGYDPLPYFNSKLKNTPKYAFLDNFDAVIEPSTDMELYFYSEESVFTTNEDRKFIFKVCSSGSSESVCKKSSFYRSAAGDKVSGSIKFDCDAYDSFEINLYEVDLTQNEAIIQQSTINGVCLQVRRELRSLTEADLAKFVDVSYALWNTTEAEGLEKYGSNFHNAAYLLKLHHFNAAQLDADHIHEGNGFLLQHAKITNIFENSLKAIDPSVFLPYWDYTIDDSQKKSMVDAVIMSEKLYGRMFLPTDILKGFSYQNDKISDGRILDGRWANLKADFNTEFPDLKAAYGYMRAPWSMNPSPYISRFTSVFDRSIMLPSCQMHYDVLVSYSSMMDFFYQIAYFPHATVHTLAGGIYGCDALMPMYESGYINSLDSVYNICKNWIFTLKEFYRHNLIVPKQNCVVNEENLEESVCGFDCVEEHLSLLQKALLLSVKKDSNINLPDATAKWTEFMCDGGPGGKIFPGDHLESASPTDPSFWVVHPTIERLFHYKLLSGGFANEEWHSDPEKQTVCEKAICYNATYGYTDYWDHCCYGHFEHDQMLDFESGDRNKHIGLSNAELLKAGDPRSADYSLPYIYDGFDWDHCVDQDFEGLYLGDIDAIMAAAAAQQASSGQDINGSPSKTADGDVPDIPPPLNSGGNNAAVGGGGISGGKGA
mmetsp:Transcript_30896/g.42467  ORF Transcript_30896/g.42467 Transcript_30896/m.42467 type:complete len:748 (-) Transcript_30896:235-2478(-)